MPVREGGRYVADDKGELTPDAADAATKTPAAGAVDKAAERVGGEKPVDELDEKTVKAPPVVVPPAPAPSTSGDPATSGEPAASGEPAGSDAGATPKSSSRKGN